MLQANYCTVKQNMGVISEDAPGDSDRLPDFTKINGKVTFVPTTAPGQAYQLFDEEGNAYTVPVGSIEADIIDGRIFHEGQEGVPLFAAGKNANPEKIVYRVTYSGLRAGRIPVSLNSIYFEAIPGAVIDLTAVTPVAGAPVAGTVKGDKGDKGDTGPKGATGARGATGAKGDKGDKGDPGEVSADHATTLTTWTADAVGGRNLLKGSSAEPAEYSLAANSYYRDFPEDVLLEVGQVYTFSVIVDKLSDDEHPINIQVGTGTGKNYTRDITMRSKITLGERTIITFTPTEYHLDERTHFAWRIRNERNEIRVAYREAKLERGPVATPWTPSPEDSVQSLLEGNSLPSPFPGPDPALSLRVDNSVGTRVLVGDTMVYGDTGWRLLDNRDESQSGEIYIRRVVNTCFIRVSKYLDPGNYAKHIATIPPGFRPAGQFYGLIVDPNAGSINSIIGSYSTGALSWSRNVDSGYERPGTPQSGEITYSTTNSWPTSLPGTPA